MFSTHNPCWVWADFSMLSEAAAQSPHHGTSRVEAKNDSAQSMSVEVKEATSMVARILIPAHYSLCLCKVLFRNCRVYWCVHCLCVCLLMSGCINVAAGNPSVNQSLKVKTATNTDTHWQQVAISSISSEGLLLDRTFQSDNYKNWSHHLGRPSWCCEVALFRQCFKTHHLCWLLSPTALRCALLQRHVDSKLGVHKIFPMNMNYLLPKFGGVPKSP